MQRVLSRRALKRVQALIVAVVLACAAFTPSRFAFAVAAISPAPEIHGKIPVTLNEKFRLSLPIATTGVAWSPDGSTLAVTSNFGMRLNTYDSAGHRLSEFQSSGAKAGILNAFALINGASQVLFHVESAAKEDAMLDIRDVATGKIVKTITRKPEDAYWPNGTSIYAVSPDQKRFAVASHIGASVIYGTDDGKEWRELAMTRETGKRLNFTSLCFFPDGKLLAIGKSEGHFAVVDSTTGETLKEFVAYDAPGIHIIIDGIAVSPKGDLILTGLNEVAISPPIATPEALAWEKSDHPMASIWRISDGKQIASLPDKGEVIHQAIWDPKGRFVAFIDLDSLVIWQPDTTGDNFTRIILPGPSASLAITSDGKSLAVAASNKAIIYNISDN